MLSLVDCHVQHYVWRKSLLTWKSLNVWINWKITIVSERVYFCRRCLLMSQISTCLDICEISILFFYYAIRSYIIIIQTIMWNHNHYQDWCLSKYNIGMKMSYVCCYLQLRKRYICVSLPQNTFLIGRV